MTDNNYKYVVTSIRHEIDSMNVVFRFFATEDEAMEFTRVKPLFDKSTYAITKLPGGVEDFRRAIFKGVENIIYGYKEAGDDS